MRTVSAATTNAWKAAWKGGANRPMARATIDVTSIAETAYDCDRLATFSTSGRIRARKRDEEGVFGSVVFNPNRRPVELPNIKSVSWSRSIGQDAASCTIVLWNTEPLPIGTTPLTVGFDRPGYYSPARGVSSEPVGWGNSRNGWQGLLAPDRTIRTYEGYGFDPGSAPESDENLYQTGVWLIDSVDFTANGLITVQCRDLARVLMDQIMFPPVVPIDAYPFRATWFRTVTNTEKTTKKVVNKTTSTNTTWFRPTYQSSSNQFFNGAEAVGVRSGAYAFDGSLTSYWLGPNNTYSHGHGWIQGTFSARTVGAVKIKPWNGPYRVYISIRQGNTWLGSSVVPVVPKNVEGYPVVFTAEGIKYVKSAQCYKNKELVVKLPKNYTNVTGIRVSFKHNGIYGGDGKHVGVYDVQVAQAVTTTKTSTSTVEVVNTTKEDIGNFGEYTDIVRWVLAWGGFYHPSNSSLAKFSYSDGSSESVTPGVDRALPGGAVWGDLELAGTGGIADLGVQLFDKKPLIEVINYVKDIVNFIFYVDEFGGAVFRCPNIWSVGNYVSPSWRAGDAPGSLARSRTSTVLEIKDDETLMDYGVRYDGKNIRERVFVGNTTGNVGGTAAVVVNNNTGPFASNLRRVAGWTDQNFSKRAEAQVMADLIALRQLYTYRTSKATIPGHPGIQIDDQVRILERVTAETSLQYVQGIESTNDLETGKWTYGITCHWLGATPFSNWAFDPNKLSNETKAYLQALGKI